ncbi:MAG: lactate utilization protein [Bacteroides sp.]|nr:lactate utilization protein [Eubacterium sp.]MCM1418930.1 lactate utilization protein [Roseburia sp.]MCM1462126.1 lactate utilization protein [Bacteroides sp.]
MDEHLRRATELRVAKTIKALERNNMAGYYVRSQEELFALVDRLLEGSELITAGGSMTLAETGVTAHLKEKYAERFSDRADCKTPEETEEVFRKAYISDTFFASSNAVTEEGELYNIDGTGNRVSAMIFGPRQVVLVVGTNKLVADLKEAETRLEKYACPANAIRLSQATPCAESGECRHCHSPSRICCSYVRLAQQRKKDRIKVIFVEGSFGY